MQAGYVLSLPVGMERRWRPVAVLMAGALGNFAFAAFLTGLADRLSTISGVGAAIVAGGIFSNILVGVQALIPKQYTIDGTSLPSDGRQILRVFGRSREPADWQMHHDAFRGGELLQAKLWDQAEAHYRTSFVKYPDQPGFLAVLMHVLSISKGPAAAMPCVLEHEKFLQREHEISEVMAPLWSSAWGMAAWTFVRCPGDHHERAEDFSRRALEANPTSPYPQAVRGAVLVRAGNSEEGLAAILGRLKDLGSASDKLEFCDFIVTERLEDADLKLADFQSFAGHLRTIA